MFLFCLIILVLQKQQVIPRTSARLFPNKDFMKLFDFRNKLVHQLHSYLVIDSDDDNKSSYFSLKQDRYNF